MTHADSNQPVRTRPIVIAATVVVVGALLLVVGWRIGATVFGPGSAAQLAGDLQQVETTAGTYLGSVTDDNGEYLRLTRAAIVTLQPAAADDGENQVAVQLLATEPYGLAGDLLIARAHVIFVVNVASDSQLAAAYREASGAN